jgi:hypothetical protein
MYRLESTKTKVIGKEIARDFLKANFVGQRPLDENWVLYLARQMTAHLFTKAYVALAHMKESKTLMLMNGQHVSHAIIRSGENVHATIDVYECDDKTDLWKLFAQFDTQRVRNEKHIMRAARELFKSPQLRAVPYEVLAACGTALSWLNDKLLPNFQTRNWSKSIKAELVERYENDVLNVARLHAESGEGYIRVPVATAIIVTHRVRPDRAKAFWKNVLDGTELRKGTPQHALHRVLFQWSNKVRGRSNFYDNRDMYCLCIAWWNAWINGEQRAYVKLRAIKNIPVCSAGKKR